MTTTDTVRLPDGRLVHKGQEVSVYGWKGRYRFTGALGQDGSLVVRGGKSVHYAATRAAHPAKIRVVHRMPKEVRP